MGSSHLEVFSNIIVPEAVVLKVLEKFHEILMRTPVLESLFKRDSSTGVLLSILQNF